METLKNAIRMQGRSVNWLSRQLDVTRQTVWNWTTGKTKIPKVYKEKICSLLDVEDLHIQD